MKRGSKSGDKTEKYQDEATFLDAISSLTREDMNSVMQAKEKAGNRPKKDTTARKNSHVKQVKVMEIDLHGLVQTQAQEAVRHFIGGLRKTHREVKARFITGKGLHSHAGRGVLHREIYIFVQTHFFHAIKEIDPPPWESTLDGTPLRGYFEVVFIFRGKK